MSICFTDCQKSICEGNDEDIVTLIIPEFLQISLNCFTRNSDRDITCRYNLNLRTPEDIPLYITEEEHLRDTLKQYCLYKQLCLKVEEEMRLMNLDLKIDDRNVRLIKTPGKETVETAEVYKNPSFGKSEKSLEEEASKSEECADKSAKETTDVDSSAEEEKEIQEQDLSEKKDSKTESGKDMETPNQATSGIQDTPVFSKSPPKDSEGLLQEGQSQQSDTRRPSRASVRFSQIKKRLSFGRKRSGKDPVILSEKESDDSLLKNKEHCTIS